MDVGAENKLQCVDLLPSQLDAAAALNHYYPPLLNKHKENEIKAYREEKSCWKMCFCEI